MPEWDQAAGTTADDVDPATLNAAQVTWAILDSPWVSMADPAWLGRALDDVAQLQPRAVLSSHLPPAHRSIPRTLTALRSAPQADPPPLTTNTELKALLAKFEPQPPADLPTHSTDGPNYGPLTVAIDHPRRDPTANNSEPFTRPLPTR